MAKVQTPNEKDGGTHVEKTNKKPKAVFCELCRTSYLKHEAYGHLHGVQHHSELEIFLGMESFHDCHVCKKSYMGLNDFAQHISTTHHKAMLKALSKNVKPLSLSKTLDSEMMVQILQRNKTEKSIRREQKKEMKKKEKKEKKKKEKGKKEKKKKKAKPSAGLQWPEMLQGTAKKMVVSKVNKQKNSIRVRRSTLKQMRKTHCDGSNIIVVKNKADKVSSLQRPPQQRESTLPIRLENMACPSGDPARGTQQHPHVPYWVNLCGGNSSLNGQCSKAIIDTSQSRRHGRHDTHTSAHQIQEQKSSWPPISQHDHYNKQCDSEVITLEHSLSESMGSSQPGPEGPPQPASANGSASAAPIQAVDVGAMLPQIRRVMGLREPCRADREARKKSNIPVVSSPAPASPSTSAPYMPTQVAVKKTLGRIQHCEKSSKFVNDLCRPSKSTAREAQAAIDSHNSLSRNSEPNPSITGRVRIAHVPRKVHWGRGAGFKPALHRMLISFKTTDKLSWREIYEGTKRRKQDRMKGTARFGIELLNPPTHQVSSTQAEDLFLSEGFHWESLLGNPSGAPSTEQPAPPQEPTHHESQTEAQTEAQAEAQTEAQVVAQTEAQAVAQEAAQEASSRETVQDVSVKVEPSLGDKDGDVRDHSSAKKRMHKEHDGISETGPTGKRKKKPCKDQNPMDQLLAVSLREEELSHSLQDVDKSLIQARDAMQAAYTEVQRLLFLKQQCTAEVNSLRARRIEILQGMRGGPEGATSSPAGAAAVQFSPLPPSTSQQPSPSNPASSISLPHPAALSQSSVPLKQEICQLDSCSPGTPQAPVNPPVSLFPSLLLPSPHIAAPPTPLSSRELHSTPVNSSPKTPARSRGQAMREGLKNCVKDGSLKTGEHDSEGRNASPAAGDKDRGNKSEDSVEMVALSNQVVIDLVESDEEETVSHVPVHEEPPQRSQVVIDLVESDEEETVSHVPVHEEPPQRSVSVEFSSACTQTIRLKHEIKPELVALKDAGVPPGTVEVLQEPYVGAFESHTGPVLGLQIHEGLLYTCSSDNTARAYSLTKRECQTVFKGHTNKVNCLQVSSLPDMPARLYTGSSDQTICCYSIKTHKCLERVSLSDGVLCLHIAWNILFAGLANGSVASYDLKTLRQLDVFECHGPRGVSCMGTAQEGARRVLLVGSYDATISVRDAKSGLLLRSLKGHTKTVLCMRVVNDLVFSGSSDASIHAYNIHTGELVRIYKGHHHGVTSIAILGKVMVTASLDQLVRVYELQSHDRLQVYGGHSDMLICMAVHKSVIYTGCYDGSIGAVKLNLITNYRCRWQSCTLIFGVAEHLVQHLVGDHTNPNLETVRCRWRDCSCFFAMQQSVRQELPGHMQSHVENDSEVQP